MTISKHVHEACKQEIDHHHAMAIPNGGLHFSDPDVMLLPPLLIPDLSVFLPALLSFRNWGTVSIFVCFVRMWRVFHGDPFTSIFACIPFAKVR